MTDQKSNSCQQTLLLSPAGLCRYLRSMILNNLKDTKLILASGSPRRQELIRTFGLPVEKRVKEVDESFPETLKRAEVARYLASKKAAAFEGELASNELLITADTIVCLGDEVLNKPSNYEEAFAMLRKLSGREHSVISAFCLKSTDREVCEHDEAFVSFTELEDAEIDHYIRTCEPFDKAGAYGIQELIGFIAVRELRGSFYTVMGLPVHRLYQALKAW